MKIDPLFRQIGSTPLVALNSLGHYEGQPHVYAKCEFLNATGSGKARQALGMISRALEKHSGLTLLDAGSGGTAEAEAMIAARLGIPFTVIIPASTPKAKIAAVTAYGANIIYSPAREGSEGARRLASDLAKNWPTRYYFLDQYNNDANWQSHLITADEIYEQTRGQVAHVFIGVGTGGTITGIATGLKSKLHKVVVHAVTPSTAQHRLYGLKYLTRDNWPEILRGDLVDEWLQVSDHAAFEAANYLSKKEGLLVGPSTGAVLTAWREKAAEVRESISVLIAHDDGRKYQDLFPPILENKEDDLCSIPNSYVLTLN